MHALDDIQATCIVLAAEFHWLASISESSRIQSISLTADVDAEQNNTEVAMFQVNKSDTPHGRATEGLPKWNEIERLEPVLMLAHGSLDLHHGANFRRLHEKSCRPL